MSKQIKEYPIKFGNHAENISLSGGLLYSLLKVNLFNLIEVKN